MQRMPVSPRPRWQEIVEAQGLVFHTADSVPYWDESACYHFTAEEIDLIEKATYELDRMCLEAVEYVLETGQLAAFGIPFGYHDLIRESWEKDELTVVGRFDLSYDGQGGAPRLLEYNADTPTSLLEAAVIQWFWMKDVFGEEAAVDQFNSIHERLIGAWKAVREAAFGAPVHFTCIEESDEDFLTTTYLRDTAEQAGLRTAFLDLSQVGWNPDAREFRGLDDEPIHVLFKLYPWEMIFRDEFGAHIGQARTRWFEPPWKAILSNKAILPVLYRLFPDSPYLLKASFEPLVEPHVMKPIHSREGANIRILCDGQMLAETGGPYTEGPHIYQELAPLPDFDGRRAVLGSWMVNGYACGLGIREDDGPITTNLSRFVPHIFTS